MLSWLARRVAVSAFLIFVLLSAVFFIVRLAPGDPLDQVVEENLGPDNRELIRRQMGLDESLLSNICAGWPLLHGVTSASASASSVPSAASSAKPCPRAGITQPTG